jgi:GDP-mannose transporter
LAAATFYNSYNDKIDGSLNVLLVVFQAVAAVVLVEGCRYAKLVDYPPLTLGILKAWAPVNIFFCLMLFTSMAALQTNTVPMVTVFKNVANICTAAGDYFFYGNRSEGLAMAAFGVMLGGAVFASSHDVSMTWKGLFWMLANCLSTSGYVLYMKHATQTIQMNKFGMVFVNNVLCVLFLLPLAMLSGEVSIFLQSPAIHTPDYALKNAFAGFVGFFLNFASLTCVAAAGPTTYAIVGSLNKVPVTFLGMFFFDTPMNHETAFFVAVSICGGFLYSYAKIRSSQQRAVARQDAK